MVGIAMLRALPPPRACPTTARSRPTARLQRQRRAVAAVQTPHGAVKGTRSAALVEERRVVHLHDLDFAIHTIAGELVIEHEDVVAAAFQELVHDVVQAPLPREHGDGPRHFVVRRDKRHTQEVVDFFQRLVRTAASAKVLVRMLRREPEQGVDAIERQQMSGWPKEEVGAARGVVVEADGVGVSSVHHRQPAEVRVGEVGWVWLQSYRAR